MTDDTDDSQPATLRYGQADRRNTPSGSLEVSQSSISSTQDCCCTVHVFLARSGRPPFCYLCVNNKLNKICMEKKKFFSLVPEQVRMKKTSIVRRKSRVRSLTPMVQCRAMDHGACGNADSTIRATGATTSGMCRLRSVSKQVSQHCSTKTYPENSFHFLWCCFYDFRCICSYAPKWNRAFCSLAHVVYPIICVCYGTFEGRQHVYHML